MYRHKAGASCGCGQHSVMRYEIESDFLHLIELLDIKEEYLSLLVQWALELNEESPIQDESDFEQKKAEAIAICQRRIDATIHLYGEGRLSRPDYEQRIEQSERELNLWKTRASDKQKITIELTKVKEVIRQTAFLWHDSSEQDKQGLAQTIFDYIVYDLDAKQIVGYKLKGWAERYMTLRGALYEGYEGEHYKGTNVIPTGFGVTIYHPADTFTLTGQDIGVYFSQAPDVIVINTPRTLLDQWGIATPDLYTAMDAYVQNVIPSYRVDAYLSTTIGDYDALFVDSFDESTRSRIISYMVVIENGYFSFTLYTQYEGDDLAYRVRTMHSIIKTIKISPRSMPDGVLSRTAPLIDDFDTRLTQQVSSADGLITLSIPDNWFSDTADGELNESGLVITTDETLLSVFATMESFPPRHSPDIPTDTLLIGFLLTTNGSSWGYVSNARRNLQTYDTLEPLFRYDALHETYFQKFPDEFLDSAFLITRDLGGHVMIAIGFSDNFYAHEDVVMTIINNLIYNP